MKRVLNADEYKMIIEEVIQFPTFEGMIRQVKQRHKYHFSRNDFFYIELTEFIQHQYKFIDPELESGYLKDLYGLGSTAGEEVRINYLYSWLTEELERDAVDKRDRKNEKFTFEHLPELFIRLQAINKSSEIRKKFKKWESEIYSAKLVDLLSTFKTSGKELINDMSRLPLQAACQLYFTTEIKWEHDNIPLLIFTEKNRSKALYSISTINKKYERLLHLEFCKIFSSALKAREKPKFKEVQNFELSKWSFITKKLNSNTSECANAKKYIVFLRALNETRFKTALLEIGDQINGSERNKKTLLSIIKDLNKKDEFLSKPTTPLDLANYISGESFDSRIFFSCDSSYLVCFLLHVKESFPQYSHQIKDRVIGESRVIVLYKKGKESIMTENTIKVAKRRFRSNVVKSEKTQKLKEAIGRSFELFIKK